MVKNHAIASCTLVIELQMLYYTDLILVLKLSWECPQSAYILKALFACSNQSPFLTATRVQRVSLFTLGFFGQGLSVVRVCGSGQVCGKGFLLGVCDRGCGQGLWVGVQRCSICLVAYVFVFNLLFLFNILCDLFYCYEVVYLFKICIDLYRQ